MTGGKGASSPVASQPSVPMPTQEAPVRCGQLTGWQMVAAPYLFLCDSHGAGRASPFASVTPERPCQGRI